MLDSILASLKVVTLATKVNFRSVNMREVALFEGSIGWGEFSPFLEYGFEECVPWLVSAVEAAFVVVEPPLRSEIEVNATLPAIDNYGEISQLLDTFEGVSAVKIKVGDNLALDLARIESVRQLRPKARIRIDVNGLWSVEQAHQFLAQVGEIEYVEQPCSTLEELRELKLRTSVKIVGDEVIRKASNPFNIDLTDAVDMVMLKVAPLGGVTRALEIAKHHQLPVVVSSALESAVGISHGLKLAAAVPELDFASGLGTGSLLADDLAHLPIIGGKIKLTNVEPDIQALNNFAVSADRLNWWKNRVQMVWTSGAQEEIEKRGWRI